MLTLTYRYELRRGEEIIATGHLTREKPLEVGDRIAIGRSDGIVRQVESTLGEREFHLVVQLMAGWGRERGRLLPG